MVTYNVHDGDSWALLRTELAELYAVVYSEPPYCEGVEQVRRFADSLDDERARLNFALVTAEDGGVLIGAAYGWTMPAGGWWSNADREPPAEVRAASKLAIMEWMVHPVCRGQGIGVELMRRLLDGRAEPYATLASDPRSAARGMYERAGWEQVGRSPLPWGPPMDLLVLELPAAAADGS